MQQHLKDYLASHTEEQTFTRGQQICSEGQQAEAAYYVIEGEVEVFRSESGGDSVVARLGEGQIFGEMALLRFDHYTLSVRAATDVRLQVIPPELVQADIQKTPPLVGAILNMLLDRVRDANDVLIDLDRLNRA